MMHFNSFLWKKTRILILLLLGPSLSVQADSFQCECTHHPENCAGILGIESELHQDHCGQVILTQLKLGKEGDALVVPHVISEESRQQNDIVFKLISIVKQDPVNLQMEVILQINQGFDSCRHKGQFIAELKTTGKLNNLQMLQTNIYYVCTLRKASIFDYF
jgi:hypothetical protein